MAASVVGLAETTAEECAICYLNVTNVVTPCKHRFCSSCIIQQANIETPRRSTINCCYCRRPFNPLVIFHHQPVRRQSLDDCVRLTKEERDSLSTFPYICAATVKHYFLHRQPSLAFVRAEEDTLVCIKCTTAFFVKAQRDETDRLIAVLTSHGKTCK
jgi:hypothetical protein